LGIGGISLGAKGGFLRTEKLGILEFPKVASNRKGNSSPFPINWERDEKLFNNKVFPYVR